MRRAGDFTAAVRQGRRSGRRTLVLHHLRPEQPGDQPAPLIGLVVSRAVGGSVARHRVSRRLRAQLRLRLEASADTFPPGSRTVVRALPPAAAASSADLGADLDGALARLATRPGGRR
jgi:ribonuclease P protein component